MQPWTGATVVVTSYLLLCYYFLFVSASLFTAAAQTGNNSFDPPAMKRDCCSCHCVQLCVIHACESSLLPIILATCRASLPGSSVHTHGGETGTSTYVCLVCSMYVPGWMRTCGHADMRTCGHADMRTCVSRFHVVFRVGCK